MKNSDYVSFGVFGAGTLRISKLANRRSGPATGFSFGVSWGKYGYAGGVIDADEARQLAEHIITTLKEPTDD